MVVTNSDGQAGTLTSGYTYVVINPAPTVTSISPTSGTTSGGTAVNISGTGFLSGATVSVGGTTATGVTVVNSTTITATTAAHAAGAVSVVVTNTDGKSGTLTTGYTYVVINPAPTVTSISPPSGTTAGGTAVSITGTGFLAGATVKLGGTAATGVTVVNSTTISATAPAHAAGAVSVIVTNTDSQSGTLAGGYTYTNPAPSLASVAPNSGTANGGTAVTITGTGFLAGATVKLGGTAATGVAVVNSTTITATTPAHSAGAVDVVVTNTDAQSGTLTNGYTYTANLALGVFPGDPSSATVVAGQTATYTLSLGGGGMSGSATLACTGAPAHATCAVPASQTFDAVVVTPVSVTVKTTSRTIAAGSSAPFHPGGLVVEPCHGHVGDRDSAGNTYRQAADATISLARALDLVPAAGFLWRRRQHRKQQHWWSADESERDPSGNLHRECDSDLGLRNPDNTAHIDRAVELPDAANGAEART